jgi:hypothetical protein
MGDSRVLVRALFKRKDAKTQRRKGAKVLADGEKRFGRVLSRFLNIFWIVGGLVVVG